jgi:Carboxypeptidase regulatory-like domain
MSVRAVAVFLALVCACAGASAAAPASPGPDWSGHWMVTVTCAIGSCQGESSSGPFDLTQNGTTLTGILTDGETGTRTPISGTAAGATATLDYDAGNGIVGKFQLTLSADGATFTGKLSFTETSTGYTIEPGAVTGERVRHAVSGAVVVSRCSTTACQRSPLAGVTITAKGAIAATTTTDAAGKYSFELPDGSYVVKPSRRGSTFAPVSKTVEVDGGDVSDVDFATCATPGATRVLSAAGRESPPYCRAIEVMTDAAGLEKVPIALRFRGVSWNPRGSKIDVFWGKTKAVSYPASSGFTGTLLSRRWQRRTLAGCGGVLSFRQDGFVRPVTYVEKAGDTVIFADLDPYFSTGDVTCRTDGPLLSGTPGLVITSPGLRSGLGLPITIYRDDLGKGIRALVGKRLCVTLSPAKRGVVVVSRQGNSIDVTVTRSDPCDPATTR